MLQNKPTPTHPPREMQNENQVNAPVLTHGVI